MEQKYYWILFSYYRDREIQCLSDIHPIIVQKKLRKYLWLENWKELTEEEYDELSTDVVHYTDIKIG